MASVWRRVTIAGLLSALWLVTASGHVQAQAPAKQTDSPEYQQLVGQGLREYALGNFSEAKAFFAQAHALSPNARTLRGLGMSSYELRNYVEASGYFENALTSTERPLTPQMRTEVTQLLRQAQSFMTKVQVTLEPPNAELRVDTRAAIRDAQGLVLLDPGTHELFAEAPQYDSSSRSIRTDGGEQLQLRLALRSQLEKPAETPVAAAREAPAPAASVAAAPPPQRDTASEIGPWILIGVSGAVAITGGVLLALAAKDRSSVENPTRSGDQAPMWTPELQSAQDRALPLSVAGFAALGVGVAGLAAGVIWKVTSDQATTESPAAALDVTPTGLRLRGAF